MTSRDFEIVAHLVVRAAMLAKGRFTIVEWGSGRSTVSLVRILRDLGKQFTYLSLEHDRIFAEREVIPYLGSGCRHFPFFGQATIDQVSAAADSTSDCLVVTWDKGPLYPAQRGRASRDASCDLDEYVSLPGHLFTEVGAILVDGRKRRRCLLEASQLLGNAGLALLHDAYRSQYTCAFSAFTHGARVGDELWLGHHKADDLITMSLGVEAFRDVAEGPITEMLSQS